MRRQQGPLLAVAGPRFPTQHWGAERISTFTSQHGHLPGFMQTQVLLGHQTGRAPGSLLSSRKAEAWAGPKGVPWGLGSDPGLSLLWPSFSLWSGN